MPIIKRKAVVLKCMTNCVTTAGNIFLNACGHTTQMVACQSDRPHDNPASSCPFATELNPARITSAKYDAAMIVIATKATAIGGGEFPSKSGNPKNVQKINIKGG